MVLGDFYNPHGLVIQHNYPCQSRSWDASGTRIGQLWERVDTAVVKELRKVEKGLSAPHTPASPCQPTARLPLQPLYVPVYVIDTKEVRYHKAFYSPAFPVQTSAPPPNCGCTAIHLIQSPGVTGPFRGRYPTPGIALFQFWPGTC